MKKIVKNYDRKLILEVFMNLFVFAKVGPAPIPAKLGWASIILNWEGQPTAAHQNKIYQTKSLEPNLPNQIY